MLAILELHNELVSVVPIIVHHLSQSVHVRSLQINFNSLETGSTVLSTKDRKYSKMYVVKKKKKYVVILTIHSDLENEYIIYTHINTHMYICTHMCGVYTHTCKNTCIIYICICVMLYICSTYLYIMYIH